MVTRHIQRSNGSEADGVVAFKFMITKHQRIMSSAGGGGLPLNL